MLHNITFSDISRLLRKINRESWFVKVLVIVTSRHIICVDTDNKVEFFRCYYDNTKKFYVQLSLLYQAMLNYDFDDIGPIRPEKSNKYSVKLYRLWKQANETKLLKLL